MRHKFEYVIYYGQLQEFRDTSWKYTADFLHHLLAAGTKITSVKRELKS